MTASTVSLNHSAQAQFATTRNNALATFGPAVGEVMTLLGLPPMPWQQQVLNTACEVDPSGVGWRYKTVVLTVPRQSGKSSLASGLMIHRALTQNDFRGWMSAQTGQSARDLWREWNQKANQALPGRWKVRLSNGEETMTWPSTGGTIRAFPPTADSLHGKQADTLILDEVFSYTMECGEDILQAVIPTQATRPWRQTWIISTAGGEDSDWMRSWIEKGRQSLSDPNSTIAHFEWSAPDEARWDDPETWTAYHPAYGLTQTHDSFLVAAEQLGEAGFSRAYLNRWASARFSWRQKWATLPENGIPAGAQVFIAADSCPRHTKGSIVAASAGTVIPVEVIEYSSGVDWILPRLIELSKNHGCEILIARTGPLAHIILDLEREGVRIRPVTAHEYQDAVSTFTTLVVADRIAHQRDPRLDQSVSNAQEVKAERPSWRRVNHQTDISPLVAASLAVLAASAPLGVQVF